MLPKVTFFTIAQEAECSTPTKKNTDLLSGILSKDFLTKKISSHNSQSCFMIRIWNIFTCVFIIISIS